jgi:hypothetical protein
MTSYLNALLELPNQFAAEERGDREQQAAYWLYDFDDPSDQWDFVMLMISIVIMLFGIWWVTPWS